MCVSNEKCKKAAKTKGLSLLKTFGISGFSYVANATTEPLGEVTFLNGRWSNEKKVYFEKILDLKYENECLKRE